MEIVQAVKKLNSISPARLNFFGDGRFCVQLCRETLRKRATSVAHLNNVYFEFFMHFHRRCLSTLSIPWRKKVKHDQKLKSRGPEAEVDEIAGASLKLVKSQCFLDCLPSCLCAWWWLFSLLRTCCVQAVSNCPFREKWHGTTFDQFQS